MTPLLKITDIGKRYGDFRALSNVNCSVEDGETFAIVGPNGAGKTTLFRVITGEILNDEGNVEFLGQDISSLPAHERVNLGIGRTFQVARVFPEFDVLTNVIVAIEARNRARRELRGRPFDVKPASEVRDEAAQRLLNIGLEKELKTEARHLSLGSKKRLELALTLALEPVVILLDEPAAGMSQTERHSIIDLIGNIKSALGLTIILTEHNMDFIFRLANRIMVMNQGQVVMVGDKDSIQSSETVREIYLGKEMAGA